MILEALSTMYLTQALVAPPVIARPPAETAVRETLRALGDTFQIVGHCSRYIPEAEMQKVLFLAEAHPEDQPYLMMRLGKGSQAPKDPAWCNRSVAAFKK